jgi:hypothetical protein
MMSSMINVAVANPNDARKFSTISTGEREGLEVGVVGEVLTEK